MFYCPNCNNIYDITKNIPNIVQNIAGGADMISDTPETVSSIANTSTETNISNVIDFILKNNVKKEDLRGYTMTDISQSEYYKKLAPKSKNIISGKLTSLDKSNQNKENTVSNAYFICRNCGNNEIMKPNTLIVRKNYIDAEISGDISDMETNQRKNMADIKCLPITRNYVCHNKKCQSFTDPSKRKAKFYRIHGSFKIGYICMTCKESWTA